MNTKEKFISSQSTDSLKGVFAEMLKQKLKDNIELLETITKNDVINEAAPRLVLRVNFRGQRIKKRLCPRGFHLVGTKCMPFNAKQKLDKKIAIRKSVRTKKADTVGKRRSTMKRILAMKKRKQQGVGRSSTISK